MISSCSTGNIIEEFPIFYVFWDHFLFTQISFHSNCSLKVSIIHWVNWLNQEVKFMKTNGIEDVSVGFKTRTFNLAASIKHPSKLTMYSNLSGQLLLYLWRGIHKYVLSGSTILVCSISSNTRLFLSTLLTVSSFVRDIVLWVFSRQWTH